jgi:hypothetical protein
LDKWTTVGLTLTAISNSTQLSDVWLDVSGGRNSRPRAVGRPPAPDPPDIRQRLAEADPANAVRHLKAAAADLLAIRAKDRAEVAEVGEEFQRV